MNIEEVFANLTEFSKFANKELGQNYLINQNIASKIVGLLNIDKDDNVLEVGSGFASLSIYLIDEQYKTLTLNDIDPRSINYLEEMVEKKKRTYVINKSALKIDVNIYNKIVSNIPYYITNDLLEHLLVHSNALKYVFMVQKEVVNRITSKENTEEYGPLAILVNYIGKFKKELEVKKEDFLPMPHVSSVVFSITKNNKNDIDKYKYLQFLKRVFLHRRKTIYNNLSLFLMNKSKAKDILDNLKISILVRPEQISPKVYLEIFKLTNKK